MAASHDRPTAPAQERAAGPPLRFAFAIVALALMPFPLILKGFGDPLLSYDYHTIIFPVDAAFAGLLVTGLPALIGRVRARRSGVGALLWTALAVVMSLAWFAHPSVRGVHTVFELWGTAVLAATLAEVLATEFAGLAVGTVATIAVVEALWAGLQLVTGKNLGLHRLGEFVDPLFHFSRSVEAPMGSMVHIYVLAGLALVAGGVLAWRAIESPRPGLWLAAAALAVAPVGVTYSRAGLLGLGLLVGGMVSGALHRRTTEPSRRRYLMVALALTAGALIPAGVWSGGWRTRANQTTSATNGAELTTDRGRLDHEAFQQITAHPLAGVGPGRYVTELQGRFHVEADSSVRIFKPVHNVPLLITAEGGLGAGLIIAALYLVVGWRSIRAGPAAFGIYVAYLPFSMLDHFPYSFPQGLVITAVWLAALDHLAARAAVGRDPYPAPKRALSWVAAHPVLLRCWSRPRSGC